MQTRLVRSESDKMIGGVCGGIAAYLNVDSVLVRFAFIMLLFASGIGLPLYFVLLILMPAEGSEVANNHPDWRVQEEIKIDEDDINNVKENRQAGDGRSHPQGPIIFAMILIGIGLYLLAQNIGFLGFLDIGWFGPLLIIGIGFYVIYRGRGGGE